MRLLLSTVFIALCFAGNTQYLSKLDEDNGFKKFKFGSSSETVTTKEKMSSEYKLKNVDIYIYTGDDMKTIYGVPIKEVELWYYKNKLYSISINIGSPFKEYTLNEFNVLTNGLEIKYGTSWVKAKNSEDVLNSAIWDSQKIRLENMRYDLTAGRKDGYNHIIGYIHLYNKATYDLQAKDELSD